MAHVLPLRPAGAALRADLALTRELLARNGIKPVIDRKVAFEAVPDALKLMKEGGHFGKIVVEFPGR